MFSFFTIILQYCISYAINAQSTGIILISKSIGTRLAILRLQMNFSYKNDTIWLAMYNRIRVRAWLRIETFVFWCGYLCAECRNALESPRSNHRVFFTSSARKTRMRLGRSRFSLDQQANGFENTFFRASSSKQKLLFLGPWTRCCVDAAVIPHYYGRQTLETRLWPNAKWHSSEWTGGYHSIGLPCCLLLPLPSVSHHVMRFVLASSVRLLLRVHRRHRVTKHGRIYNRIITRRAHTCSVCRETKAKKPNNAR